MTNLMHGTMMTQRKVMVGAKSGLHFKSMPKYYRKCGLQEKVFTTRLHFLYSEACCPCETNNSRRPWDYTHNLCNLEKNVTNYLNSSF